MIRVVFKVVGREVNGMFVLFSLGDGVYATVTKDGEVRYSLGWANMTKFVTIDTRGAGAVPAEELRTAKFVLNSKYDPAEVEELRTMAIENMDEVEFNEAAQERYSERIAQLPVNPDGSLRLYR